MKPAPRLSVSVEQRGLLEKVARSSSLPHRQVIQARALLWAGDGVANEEIARRCAVDSDTVRRWRKRFVERGVGGVGVIAAGRGRKSWLPEGTGSPWVWWRLFLLVSNQQFAAPFRIVDLFVFGWGNVAEVSVEALVVEPVHPPQRGELDVGNSAPGSLVGPVDEFGLVEAVHCFRQRIIRTVPNRPYRGHGPELFESFRVSDRRVLRPCV